MNQSEELTAFQKLFANKKVQWYRISSKRHLNDALYNCGVDCEYEWKENSLIGIVNCEFCHNHPTSDGVVMRSYDATLLIALDKNCTGLGGLHDIQDLFLAGNKLYDMNFTACNGYKCRLGGEKGVWCVSCFGELEENLESCEDWLFNQKIKMSDIKEDMIKFSSIEYEDRPLSLDKIEEELSMLTHQISEKQKLIEQLNDDIDKALELKNILERQKY